MLTLWGGTDIDSIYYNALRNSRNDTPDTARDKREINAYYHAVRNNEPVLGICRGAQLVSVLNGASLYQHSIGHNKNHPIKCLVDDRFIVYTNVAADHHQIINLNLVNPTTYTLLGYSDHITTVWTDETTTKEIKDVPEIIYFPHVKTMAVQPHPEWMKKDHPFNIWLDRVCTDYLGESLWHFIR